MPIITKPASVEKNVAASITLNKSQLASVASVAADSYFSNSANWKSVSIHYKSSAGNQIEVIRFDATQASPSASFLVSDKARDIFEVKKIVITDFDFGSLTVERAELPVVDFDITFSSGSSAVVWDTFISGFTLGANGAISKAGAVSDYGTCPRSSNGFASDFELTFEAMDSNILNGWCAGVSTSISSNPENGANQLVFYFESGSGNLNIFCQGSFAAQNIPLQSGNNIFKLARVGSTLSFYMNGNPSALFSIPAAGILYPEARVGGSISSASFI